MLSKNDEFGTVFQSLVLKCLGIKLKKISTVYVWTLTNFKTKIKILIFFLSICILQEVFKKYTTVV